MSYVLEYHLGMVLHLSRKHQRFFSDSTLRNSHASRQSGIALVTVLVTALVVLAMLTVVISLTTRSSRITASDTTSSRLAQMADGWSDVARIAVADSYRTSKLSVPSWLNLISADRNNATQTINPTAVKVASLAGKHSSTLDGATLRWEIKGVSRGSDRSAWVQIGATAVDASGRSQTVLRKVQFASSNIFELAILTEKTDCMFCHLKVDGDVGSIGFFRPGWGDETKAATTSPVAAAVDGSGKNSGASSSITGNVYAASTISTDGTDSATANGTTISGSKTASYTGDKLPKDASGAGAFPGLDRVLAKDSATGSISGGTIQRVASGSLLSSATTATTITNNYDGNVVMVGTDANPIVLDGDVYISGDVVIKGVVKGRGAIYAGRNTYIAGNLTNKNKADKIGAGVCATTTDKDTCARSNIAANKDEVRISAGNNVIMGDFTDTRNGQTAANSGRQNQQANDYMKAQFGMWGGDRYVRKGTSEELKASGTPLKYYDQLGKEVPSSEAQTFTGGGFEQLMTPGATNSSGTFSRWMSDTEYQGILGTENIATNTWRTGIKKADFNTPAGLTNAQIKAKIVAELERSGLPGGANADTSALADRIMSNTTGSTNYSGTDSNGQPVSGTAFFDNGSLRVAILEAKAYKTETTALDAFLYANNRIAGKLSPRGGYINGGMIAREIGILAQGKNNGSNWWIENWDNTTNKAKGIASSTTRDQFNKCDRTARPTDGNGDSGNVGTDCDYAINYDYRLRNGGYGYNLYKGVTGTTQEWKFDLQGNQKVQP